MFGLFLLFIGQSIVHVSCILALKDNITVFDYGDNFSYHGTFISSRTYFTGELNAYNDGFSDIDFYFASCKISAKWKKSGFTKQLEIQGKTLNKFPVDIRVEENRVEFYGGGYHSYYCDIGFIETYDDNTKFAIKIKVATWKLARGLELKFNVPLLDEYPKSTTKSATLDTTVKVRTKEPSLLTNILTALLTMFGCLLIQQQPIQQQLPFQQQPLMQQLPIQQLPVQQQPIQQQPFQQQPPIQEQPMQQQQPVQQPTPQMEAIKTAASMSNYTSNQSTALQSSNLGISATPLVNVQPQQATTQLPTETQAPTTMNAQNQAGNTLQPSTQQSSSNVQPSQSH
ncbi:hypothetical protein M3Y95_01260400 [Aphelenchoides besseyi]|nr:hypothetical protein M3Y95_01260400 [Aphelenchoides besseyi]